MLKIGKENSLHILNIGTKILLKDVMDQYLRSLGEVKTFYASKLNLAVETFREKKPQVVFCEHFFSEGNVLDFIRAIGGLHHGDEIYFVLATEGSSDELMALAIEQGIDEILIKPFATEHVEQTIERFFAKRAMQSNGWLQDIHAARATDQAKRFQEAEALYMSVVQKHGENINALVESAEFFYHRLNYDVCLQILDKAGKLSPSHVRTLALAGSALKKAGRYREALDRLHKASALSPLNTLRNLEIADVHLLLADERISQALHMDTENTQLILQKARVLCMQRDYAGTVHYLELKQSFLSEVGKKEAETMIGFCKKIGGLR